MRSGRGYTLVELMVAARIATISLYASLNMAAFSMRGNTELRDSQAALRLAEHVVSTVQAEGWLWTTDEVLSQLLFLRMATLPPTIGQTSGWQSGNHEQFNKDRRVGALGNSQAWDAGALQEIPNDLGARYCVFYRLIWVADDMLRAEVRVIWPREHLPADELVSCPNTRIDDVPSVNTVSLTGVVRRNSDVL